MTKQTSSQVSYEEIKVYWDESDPHNIGWAYRAIRNGVEESGAIEAPSDDLTAAIEEATRYLGANVRADAFAIDRADGGFAVWNSDDD